MPSCKSFSRSASLIAGAALLVSAGLAGSRPAFALDDDGNQNVFISVLGLLDLTPRQDDADIEYRERAPLVLPPKMDLQPPAARPQRSAEWPQDPDVLRRKKAAQQSLIPALLSRHGDGGRLTKEQLVAGRGTPQAAADTTSSVHPAADLKHCGKGECTWVPPATLSAEGDSMRNATPTSSDIVRAGVEPDRKYLSDPPKGYRMATGSVKATTDGPAVVHEHESLSTVWNKLNPFSTTDDGD